MQKLKDFARKRPFVFGLILFFFYAVLGALSYPVHFLLPETEGGQLIGDALSKLIAFLVFLFLLWRFDWLEGSGITRWGKPLVWVVFIPLLSLKVLGHLYAFTGDFSFPIQGGGLAASMLGLQLTTSLVEETMVRGLVLTAMITAWGSTKSGQFRAVVLSSLYFGLIHLINLAIRPAGVVILQALILSLPGLFYAALVLKYRTLWPGIIMHWLVNASVNIKLIGVENFQETLSMWAIIAAVSLPLAILGIYWVWKLPVEGGNQEIPEGVPALP
jgi:membrane protease YdiL (CAAX protease family)